MTEAVSFHFYEPRTRSLISLTPLIDVVFILLLFFMLASNFNVETSLSVQSSGSQSTASTKPPGRLRILDSQNFVLDGEVLNRIQLTEALTALYNRDADRALSISVAEGTQVQELLDMIALAETIGLTHVTMESLIP